VALRLTGLTNLLYEVAMPQNKMQPVACLLQRLLWSLPPNERG
jgi:hypothetical protein